MLTEPVRNTLQSKLCVGFVLTLSLFPCPAQVLSETVPDGHLLVRFVCQAHSAGNQHFLDRVLILEQVSTQPHNSGTALSDTIDGVELTDSDHETSSTDEAPFRARIFEKVSLVSNLPELLGHDLEPAVDLDQTERQEELRRYRTVRQTSRSLGSTDDEVIAELRNRDADLDVEGQRMDYIGIGARSGGRFAFRSSGPYRRSKNIDIFLKISRGVVESGLGTWNSPEDGPYVCKEPILLSALTEGLSGCMRENKEPVDISTLANDRSLVRHIQRSLAEQDFDPGPFDGIFGWRTYSALQAWRESQGYGRSDILMPSQLCTLLHSAPR